MKILRTYFGEIVISLFINIVLINTLLRAIEYSHFIKSDYFTFLLIFLTPFLHIFLSLFLIQKIFKKSILSSAILYLTTNSIYFLYSYSSAHFTYEHIYLFTPFIRNDPTDDQFLVEAFRSVYFMNKVTFVLFIISVLALVVAIILRKYRAKLV